MKKEKKDEEPEYDFRDESGKSVDDLVDERLIKLEEQRKTAEDIHILDIKKNPPEPGYMRVELKKAVVSTKDEDDRPLSVIRTALPLDEKMQEPPKQDPTVFVNANGDTLQTYDTIFDVDLKQMYDGQVSDCSSTIFPMLMDEAVQLALDEKKIRSPEKRKEEFKWWWVLVLLMILIPIILITIQVLPGLGI